MALTEEEGNDAYFENFELLLHEPQDKERDGSVAQGLFSHTHTHTHTHTHAYKQIRRSRVKGRDLVCDHSCEMDEIVHEWMK
jgi:hypothetical protein